MSVFRYYKKGKSLTLLERRRSAAHEYSNSKFPIPLFSETKLNERQSCSNRESAILLMACVRKHVVGTRRQLTVRVSVCWITFSMWSNMDRDLWVLLKQYEQPTAIATRQTIRAVLQVPLESTEIHRKACKASREPMFRAVDEIAGQQNRITVYLSSRKTIADCQTWNCAQVRIGKLLKLKLFTKEIVLLIPIQVSWYA